MSRWRLAYPAVLALLLAGCSTQVAGAGHAPVTNPTPPDIAVAAAESHRLAPYVVDARPIFTSSLADGTCDDGPRPVATMAATVILARTDTPTRQADPTRLALLRRAGYDAGSMTCGRTDATDEIGGQVLVMETHDPARANALVSGLQADALRDPGARTAVVPSAPSAVASSAPGHHTNEIYLDAFRATGRMVTYATVHAPTRAAGLPYLSRLLAAQRPLTARFKPTTRPDLGIEDDPLGLAGATVPFEHPSWAKGGYTLTEWAAVVRAPTEIRMLRQAGISEVYVSDDVEPRSYDRIVTVRTGTRSAATHLAASLSDWRQRGSPGWGHTRAPRHPDIRCLYGGVGDASPRPAQVCTFAAGRYVIEAFHDGGQAQAAASEMIAIGSLIDEQLKLTPR